MAGDAGQRFKIYKTHSIHRISTKSYLVLVKEKKRIEHSDSDSDKTEGF